MHDASLSPKDAAAAIGVSESSLRRWVDAGRIVSARTPGGHRHIPIAALVAFAREAGYSVVQPQLLETVPHQRRRRRAPRFEEAGDALFDLLTKGDEQGTELMLVRCLDAEIPLVELCDPLLTAVFERIGTAWAEGRLSIYEERRACSIVTRCLFRLQSRLPPLSRGAPLALAATLPGDFYSVGMTMTATLFRAAGWRVDMLGTQIPAASLREAIQRYQPRAILLAVNHVGRSEDLEKACSLLAKAAQRAKAVFLVGGRGLSPGRRRRLRFDVYCKDLPQAAELAQTLQSTK